MKNTSSAVRKDKFNWPKISEISYHLSLKDENTELFKTSPFRQKPDVPTSGWTVFCSLSQTIYRMLPKASALFCSGCNTWVFKIRAEDISERWNPSIFKNLCTSDTANQTADAKKMQSSDEVYLLTLHCRWRIHSSPHQFDVQSVISF